MSNIHVMADVENLSVEPNGPVLTIGLVAFDITSGEIVAEFYERMDRNLAQKYGTPSLSTLKWWESQDEAARAEAYNGTSDPRNVARSLREWFVKYNLGNSGIWGNGSVMDIAQLEWWLRQTNPVIGKYGQEYPWRYYNIYDMRTIMMLAGMQMPRTRPAHIQYHNALHDARYQVEWVCKAYAKLNNKPAVMQQQQDVWPPDVDSFISAD